jgi:hypothetical protein
MARPLVATPLEGADLGAPATPPAPARDRIASRKHRTGARASAPRAVLLTEGLRMYRTRVRGAGPNRTPLKVMAAQIGVESTMVSELLAGRTRPSLDLAARIYRVHGIRPELWCEKPVSGADNEVRDEC